MNIQIMRLLIVMTCVVFLQFFCTSAYCTAGDSYSSSGYIDQIDSNKVIIDDSSYYMTSASLCYDSKGRRVARASIQVGCQVSYVAKKNTGEIVFLTMESCKESRPGTHTTSQADQNDNVNNDAKSSSGQEVIFENGVWHN